MATPPLGPPTSPAPLSHPPRSHPGALGALRAAARSALATTRPTAEAAASTPTSLKREPPAPLELIVPKSVRLSLDAAAAASSAAALATSARASAAPAPAPSATVRPAAPVVAWRAQPGPAPPPRVAVADGRRAPEAEAKRADNASRAAAAQLTSESSSFFSTGVLNVDASAQHNITANAIMARARERTERANHISKDKRLGTALSKFELLAGVLPSVRKFERLAFEGDLDTSERNELLLMLVAQFVRERPKATGDLVQGNTVASQVSAIKTCVEDHLGRKIIAPSGGVMLKKLLRQMRFEDGPAGERKFLAPLRAAHFARLAALGQAFDISSPGWPTARWALLLVMHQCLLRGGEPGRLPRDKFRPALGICWIHIVWLDPASQRYATVRDKVTGLLHWNLTIRVRSIKDTEGKLKRVPIPIASKHPSSQPLGDPTCPYTAVRRLWCERELLVPRAERALASFFLGPKGQDAVTTDEARDAIRSAATALDLDSSVFGAGSACRRGGATDLRDQLGHREGKQIVIDRGRWCPTGDIDDIYARASLEEHASASVGLANAGQGVSLEEANPGWVQPSAWRRT